MRVGLACALIVGAVAYADGPKRISTSALDEVIPQVVAGGGWKTSFTFVNMEDQEVKFPVAFRTGDGQAWRVNFDALGVQSTVNVTIPAKGTFTFSTADVGELTQGWAQADLPCCPDISGYAIFRQRVPGRPDFEAVVPMAPSFSTRSVLAFDNTEGNSTGIALVSTSSFTPATVTVAIRDESGTRIALDQFSLARQGKMVFTLPEKYRETIGKRGSVEFTSSPGQFAVLGLRFNPTGAFTSIHSLEP